MAVRCQVMAGEFAQQLFRRDFELRCAFADRLQQIRSATSVFQLNIACTPTAVFRGVVTIIINSIDRMKWRWSQTHVSGKSSEVVSPAIANFDASATIMAKACRVRVFTSCDD